MKPRISLRDVLWITTLSAVLLGWAIDRHRWESEAFQARSELRRTKLELTSAESWIQHLRIALARASGTSDAQ
jgi:hypothetical protein